MWEERVALSPEYQTRLGRKTRYDEWDDRSPEADDRYARLLREQLTELDAAFDRANLSEDGQLNYDLFIATTENNLALEAFRMHRYPLSQFRGIHSSIPVFLKNDHEIETVSDADAYIARVASVDQVLDQAASQLEARVRAGFTLPEFSYPLMAEAAENNVTGKSVREDFAEKLVKLDLTDEERGRLQGELEAALEGPYAAGFEDFAARIGSLADEVAGSGNFGVGRFDDGEAYYAALLRNYTTTDLTADEVHDIGLAEVARIQNEMRAIMEEVGHDGSLEEFFEFMRTD
ncbi:MAG: DUF885 domain-containing protein, partial [Planctomycetota bacterium]